MTDGLHTLTGAYALDALAGDELEAFEAHLTDCGMCPGEAAELRATATRLASVVESAPPAALRDRVLLAARATAQERQESRGMAADTPESSSANGRPGDGQPVSLADRRNSRRRRILVGAGSLLAAAAVAAGAIVVVDARNDAPGVEEILAASDARTLIADTGGNGTAEIVMAPSLDAAVIRMTDIEPPADGKTYQAWVIEGDEILPSDTFEPDASGDVTEVLTGADGATGFGVTVEPDGGSPTGLPTLPTVMDFSVT